MSNVAHPGGVTPAPHRGMGVSGGQGHGSRNPVSLKRRPPRDFPRRRGTDAAWPPRPARPESQVPGGEGSVSTQRPSPPPRVPDRGGRAERGPAPTAGRWPGGWALEAPATRGGPAAEASRIAPGRPRRGRSPLAGRVRAPRPPVRGPGESWAAPRRAPFRRAPALHRRGSRSPRRPRPVVSPRPAPPRPGPAPARRTWWWL
jgi:hypothetical protein